MAGSNAVVVKFIADTKGLTQGIDKVNGQLSGFSKTMKGVGVAIAGAFAASQVSKFATEIVSLASEMEQVAGTAETLFGQTSSKQIDDWAQGAADSLGLSERAATSAANTFAVSGKAIGLSGKDLVGFTTDLVTVAADLGAASGTTDLAVKAMASALRGEFDPLERFGIQLNATTLQAYAFEQGITTAYSSLDNATKQGLIAQYVKDQTDALNITGQFARESETFGQKLQKLGAKWENLQVTIGEKLLPALAKVLDATIALVEGFGKLIGFLEQYSDVIKNAAIVIGVFTAALYVNKLAMASGSLATGIYSAAVLGLVRVIDLATAAQARFNLMVKANPYVLAITAVAAYILWLKSLRDELIANVKATDDLIDISRKQFDDWYDFLFFAPNLAAVAFVEIEKQWGNLTGGFENEADKQKRIAYSAAWTTEGHWSDATGQIVGSTYQMAVQGSNYFEELANNGITSAQQIANAYIEAGKLAATQDQLQRGVLSGSVAQGLFEGGYKGPDAFFANKVEEWLAPAEDAAKSGGSRIGKNVAEGAEKALQGFEYLIEDTIAGVILSMKSGKEVSEETLSAMEEAGQKVLDWAYDQLEEAKQTFAETQKWIANATAAFLGPTSVQAVNAQWQAAKSQADALKDSYERAAKARDEFSGSNTKSAERSIGDLTNKLKDAQADLAKATTDTDKERLEDQIANYQKQLSRAKEDLDATKAGDAERLADLTKKAADAQNDYNEAQANADKGFLGFWEEAQASVKAYQDQLNSLIKDIPKTEEGAALVSQLLTLDPSVGGDIVTQLQGDMGKALSILGVQTQLKTDVETFMQQVTDVFGGKGGIPLGYSIAEQNVKDWTTYITDPKNGVGKDMLAAMNKVKPKKVRVRVEWVPDPFPTPSYDGYGPRVATSQAVKEIQKYESRNSTLWRSRL